MAKLPTLEMFFCLLPFVAAVKPSPGMFAALAPALPEIALAVIVIGVVAYVGYKLYHRVPEGQHRYPANFTGVFDFIKNLGRGAFGEVWNVKRRSDGNVFALKIMRGNHEPTLFEDIEKEFRLMNRLNHVNIVKYFQIYRSGNDFAILMQYCSKGDLHEYIKEQRGRQISRQVLSTWIDQLCSALEFIHGNRAIHRDLKPANILVDDQGNLQVADFGLAKVLYSYYTQSVCGTLAFMAPEIILGQEYNWRCDIYSLGCIMYCLLQCVPIPNVNGSTLDQIRNNHGDPVSNIVKDCTAQVSGDRPSATELKERLKSSSLAQNLKRIRSS